MKKEYLISAMLDQLEAPFTGEALFDHMIDLVYFIKNRDGQYVVVNQSLVHRCGYADKNELIGLTADQVFSTPLGTGYRAQDDEVLKTGQSLLNRLELQIYPSHGTGWCITNKIPLMSKNGQVIGLVGISKDLHKTTGSKKDYSGIGEVVDYVQTHYDQPLKIQDLAHRVSLSTYQLEKRMANIFEITPKQFILKVRMDAAVKQLKETHEVISEIAFNCGYSDQSTFSRQFKQTVGMSPALYRRMFR